MSWKFSVTETVVVITAVGTALIGVIGALQGQQQRAEVTQGQQQLTERVEVAQAKATDVLDVLRQELSSVKAEANEASKALVLARIELSRANMRNAALQRTRLANCPGPEGTEDFP